MIKQILFFLLVIPNYGKAQVYMDLPKKNDHDYSNKNVGYPPDYYKKNKVEVDEFCLEKISQPDIFSIGARKLTVARKLSPQTGWLWRYYLYDEECKKIFESEIEKIAQFSRYSLEFFSDHRWYHIDDQLEIRLECQKEPSRLVNSGSNQHLIMCDGEIYDKDYCLITEEITEVTTKHFNTQVFEHRWGMVLKDQVWTQKTIVFSASPKNSIVLHNISSDSDIIILASEGFSGITIELKNVKARNIYIYALTRGDNNVILENTTSLSRTLVFKNRYRHELLEKTLKPLVKYLEDRHEANFYPSTLPYDAQNRY